jgi:hypothetical protein
MSAHLVVDAVEAATRARDARTSRAFAHAVAEFIRVLSLVPDEPAQSLSADDARTIQSLGDDVIERIEKRVEADGAPGAQALVSAVYEIRRVLEEIAVWRQHYTARSV